MTFEELKLNSTLLEGLSAMGFETATPIQEQAIPAILAGKDLIACAQTGTGKTAAFLLPIINLLSENPSHGTVDTLILVPTRELAIQIDQWLEGFAYFSGLSSLAIFGGKDSDAFTQEKKALSNGADIVVATPGRLIAHLNLGYVKFEKIRCLVLDEADRMLDMGFMPDITKIINTLPKKRQTLLFSATMPPKIKKLADQILINPVSVTLSISKPAEGVTQAVYHVDDSQKLSLLKYLLTPMKGKPNRILIFSSRKTSVKDIARGLKDVDLNAGEIHSDLEQSERTHILSQFKNGNLQILVATDILARGIDVKDINLVINYDLPGDAEDYIHRVGRTARADTKGMAITFVTHKEKYKLHSIENLMEQKVDVFELPTMIKQQRSAPVAMGQKKPSRFNSNSNSNSNSNRNNSNSNRNSNNNSNNSNNSNNNSRNRRKPPVKRSA